MADHVLGEAREGRVSTATNKGRLVINETYHYIIVMDNPLATRADVLNAGLLPLPSATASPSGMGICKAVDCERRPNAIRFWDATITYSSDVEDTSGSGGDPSSNPTAWIPTRETYLEPYEEALLRDLDGKEYINGAGVPLESSGTSEMDNLRYEFFQFDNPATITDAVIKTWNNAINDAAFLTVYPKHTLKLKIRKSAVGTYYGQSLRLTEMSLIYKEDNWHDKLANYGDSFLHNGKIWPYVYKDSPDVIHKGPLGIKDYLHGDAMDARGGLPTGDNSATVANCIESVTVGGVTTVYAKPPTTPKLYFLERRKNKELDFASVLRVI